MIQIQHINVHLKSYVPIDFPSLKQRKLSLDNAHRVPAEFRSCSSSA